MSLPQKAIEYGWTIEDVEFLLNTIDDIGPVLVGGSGSYLGIPTIHDIKGARHLGYGFFEAEVEGVKVSFDAGGAMMRTPSGRGWTALRGPYGVEIPASIWNEEEVVATLESYL